MNSYSNPQSNSRALVEQTILLCGIVGLAALILIAVSIALGATLLGMAFAQWAAAILVAGAGLLIAALIVSAWNNSRWLLVEPIAAVIARQDAETEAIKSNAPAVIQTVNAEAGAKVKASVSAPRVSVRGKSVTWNQVNQIVQPEPQTKRLEFPREDVLWMLEQFVNVKHSKRPFVGTDTPYSKLPAYPELYNEVIRILVEGEAIKGRAPKNAGHLVVTDIQQLAELVDAAHPKGVIIDSAEPTPPAPALPESGK